VRGGPRLTDDVVGHINAHGAQLGECWDGLVGCGEGSGCGLAWYCRAGEGRADKGKKYLLRPKSSATVSLGAIIVWNVKT
jgi:hypothetical protein